MGGDQHAQNIKIKHENHLHQLGCVSLIDA